MSLNVNAITSGLLKTVRDLIGSNLSTYGTGANQRPSVFLSRAKPQKPSYPYAVVDHIGVLEIGNDVEQEFTGQDGVQCTVFNHKVRCIVYVYGSTTNDVLGICTNFKSLLNTSKGHRSMETNIPNAVYLDSNEVSFAGPLKSTDFEEVATLTIDLWATSTFTDSDTGTIESILLAGRLYDDFDQTKPPLEVNVNVP